MTVFQSKTKETIKFSFEYFVCCGGFAQKQGYKFLHHSDFCRFFLNSFQFPQLVFEIEANAIGGRAFKTPFSFSSH